MHPRPKDAEVGKRAVRAGLLTPATYREAHAGWLSHVEAGRPISFGEFLVARGYIEPDARAELEGGVGGRRRSSRRFKPGIKNPPPPKSPEAVVMGMSSSGLENASGDGLPEAHSSGIDAPISPEEGCDVGPYHLERKIARGGMGVIFSATHQTIGRKCALKVLCPDGPPLPEDTERFRREAQASGRLKHENIVQVSDAGYADGFFYIAMDLVDGQSLAELLGDTGWIGDERRSLRITAELCRALQHAHDAGVIHRDIKPGNVIIDGAGRPLLVDFGVAKLVGSWSGLTRPGTTVGTPSYMAPEQASGLSKKIGPHSDVYSVGAVLYEMLVGRAPFEGNNPVLVMQDVVDIDPPRPREINPEVSLDVDAIVMKALTKDIKARYKTATELAQDCERALTDLPVTARPLSTLARLARFMRRNRGRIVMTLVLLLLLAAGGAGAYWYYFLR